jgi:hypothetical protein
MSKSCVNKKAIYAIVRFPRQFVSEISVGESDFRNGVAELSNSHSKVVKVFDHFEIKIRLYFHIPRNLIA